MKSFIGFVIGFFTIPLLEWCSGKSFEQVFARRPALPEMIVVSVAMGALWAFGVHCWKEATRK